MSMKLSVLDALDGSRFYAQSNGMFGKAFGTVMVTACLAGQTDSMSGPVDSSLASLQNAYDLNTVF